MDPSDAAVVRSFAAGEVEAFACLFRRYQQQIVAFCVRMTGCRVEGEDLAQETFAKAFQALSSLQDPERFRPWLFSIAANLGRDHHKAMRHRRHLSLEQDMDIDRELPDGSTGDVELALQVRRAIDELDEDQRLVVLLYEYHQFPHKDIASIAQCPVGTVRWRLHAARQQLRSALLDLKPEVTDE